MTTGKSDFNCVCCHQHGTALKKDSKSLVKHQKSKIPAHKSASMANTSTVMAMFGDNNRNRVKSNDKGQYCFCLKLNSKDIVDISCNSNRQCCVPNKSTKIPAACTCQSTSTSSCRLNANLTYCEYRASPQAHWSQHQQQQQQQQPPQQAHAVGAVVQQTEKHYCRNMISNILPHFLTEVVHGDRQHRQQRRRRQPHSCSAILTPLITLILLILQVTTQVRFANCDVENVRRISDKGQVVFTGDPVRGRAVTNSTDKLGCTSLSFDNATQPTTITAAVATTPTKEQILYSERSFENRQQHTKPADIAAATQTTVISTTEQYNTDSDSFRTNPDQGVSHKIASTTKQASTVPASADYTANWSAAPSSAANIIKLINRNNILNRHHGNANDGSRSGASVSNNTAKSYDASGSSCPSCKLREKAKLDSLESIKMHILLRLQLTEPPNITAPIPVPLNIIENFKKNYGEAVGSRRSREHVTGHERIHPKGKSVGNLPVRYSDHQRSVLSGTLADGGDGDADADVDVDGADIDVAMQSDDPYFDTNLAATRHDYFVDDNDNESDEDVVATVAVGAKNDDDATRHNYDSDASDDDDDDGDAYDNNDDDDEDGDLYGRDDFYSHVNSIYVFPTMSHIRHNRKPEILNFNFNNDQSTISRAFMHIYLRGRDWIRENEPTLLKNRNPDGTVAHRNEIVITLHRAVRRANALNFTHTVKLLESRHKIPHGIGQWVRFEVKQLSAHWRENRNATQGIVIKGQESWMRPLIVTGDSQNKPLTVHIEVLTKSRRRRKRSTSLDCQESDREVRCCRYPLKVNFTNFGWHFVVAPTSFDAYFCNGECKVGYLEQYTHTHIASLTTSATPCCSPTKMSPLSLLYFNTDQHLVLSTIPNMSVEKCSCS